MARSASERSGQEHSPENGGKESKKLTRLIDDLGEQVKDDESLAVADILQAFGTRAFGPLVALPGLIMLTPVGAVPGVPAVVAVFIVLVAVQHLAGRAHPWLPGSLTDRSVSKDKWDRASEKARPWARRVDWLLRPRLRPLTGPVMQRVLSVIIIALAIAMFPLGFIPFATAAPGASILLFGLAISARDGLAVVLGLAATGVSGYLVWTALG